MTRLSLVVATLLLALAVLVSVGRAQPAGASDDTPAYACYLTASASNFKAAKCRGYGEFQIVMRCYSPALGRSWTEYGGKVRAPYGESWDLCYDGYYGRVTTWWVRRR